MLRVIAGNLRGRRLLVPPGLDVRPTTGRLRECYFNIVRDMVPGCRFLDICAGSGSNGIEAISRGAADVVFVERGKEALAVLEKNLASCGIRKGFRVAANDLFRELPRLGRAGEQFDLIFFDPPYFQDLYTRTIAQVGKSRLLAPGGLLAVDHFKKVGVPDRLEGLEAIRTSRQGDSCLTFYAWEDDGRTNDGEDSAPGFPEEETEGMS